MTTQPETIAPSAGENNAQNTKEYNFSQIRKQLEAERAAKQQLEERAERLEKENKELANARRSTDQDDDSSSDEPYVDHKALERKFKRWESNIDEKIEKKAEEKARALVEQERRNSYLKQNADFSEIMQPEMMQKFVERHPGLAEGILSMPDGFERQKLVYENIKALGLHKKEEPKPSIQDTINQNRKSPYYQPSGVGTAPYNTGGDFSQAGQKNAYAKLQELKSKLRI
jgi:uncharacterized protein YaaR (DUF327 family)